VSKRPNSRVNLDKAIERLFGTGAKFIEARSLLANAVVGQFLPDGVAKGGSALKLRFGPLGFRATRDLDAARRGSIEEFGRLLEERLRAGWNGFTGAVAPGRPAHPRGVPGEYVMRPFEVRLSYNGRPWCTVDLEVGHDEIGDADTPEYVLSPAVAAMFEALGFPAPSPVPLMPIPFQIAQKLHGATEPASRRAHDLVDLQLILAQGEPDWARTRAVCIRLFDYRRQQPWPPIVTPGADWPALYAAQAQGLPVLPTVEEAAAWTSRLIARIDSARPSPTP
jgi:hypothetical protein